MERTHVSATLRTVLIATACAGIAVAAMWLTATVARGQRLPVRVITTADGLPRDQIACVRTDPQGFVWFCTAEGLVRWDGHTAVTFGVSDGLSPPRVRALLRTRSGRFWVGTDAGLFEFAATPTSTGTRFQEVRRSDAKGSATVYAIAESRDGSLWVGTGQGLLRLTESGGSRLLREVDVGMLRDTENDVSARALAEDDQGTLWIGTGSGVYAHRADGRTVRVALAEGLPDNQVWAIAVGRSGTIWAGTRSGLARIAREAVFDRASPIVPRVYTDRDGLPTANVRAIHASGSKLWIGAVGGVVEAELDHLGSLVTGRTVRGFYAWDVLEDGRGDVWIATESGARKLTSRGFTTYGQQDGLAGGNAASVFVTPAGEVCVTVLVRTLSVDCFDGQRFTHGPVAALDRIRDPGWGWSQVVWQDRRGRWWIPTGEGVWQFPSGPPPSLATATPAAVYDVRRGLSSSSVVRLFEDPDGQIWIATWSEKVIGLARIDPDSTRVRTYTVADGLPDPLPGIFAMAAAPSGDIWFGLQGRRVLRYRDGRFREIPLDAPEGSPSSPTLTYEEIRSVLVDSRQRLWLASHGSGLGRIDQPDAASPRVTWYGTRHGLSSNAVWAIVEHPSGDILAGTGRGVDRLQPDTGRIAHYSAEDGVPRGEILGATRDRAGQIWLATTNGVARLPPLDAPVSAPPVTVVTGVRVGGVPLGIAADGAAHVADLGVDPGVPSVDIDYVSPGARPADGLQYQHRLAGATDGWVVTNARTITFASPPPGRYRFEVRATLASGVIGESASMEFTVLAPIWRRAWFLALASVAAALALYTGYRYRVSRLLAVERVRTRIASDLHDDIGAALSRIAVLTEVARHEVDGAHPAASKRLSVIAQAAREVIDSMNDIVWAINPRHDQIHGLAHRMRRFAGDVFTARGIAFSFRAPADRLPRVGADVRRHAFLIFKEAVNNVVRHAGATAAEVDMRVDGRRLVLTIRDNGRGFDGAGVLEGNGLGNMRGRARAMGGRLDVVSAPGTGTTVTLTVPLNATLREHDRRLRRRTGGDGARA